MLTDFADMSLDELTAEIEAMLRTHHKPRVDYAARTSSPLATTPNPLPVAHPLERVVASTYSTEQAV